jgi:PAS domain S-box-containing protein
MSGAAATPDSAGLQAGLIRDFIEGFSDPWVVLRPVRAADSSVVDFTYVEANATACRYNAVPREDLIGRRLLELLPGHETVGLIDSLARVADDGRPYEARSLLYYNELRGGDATISEVTAVPLGGDVCYMWRDVTERHRMAEALRRSEERYRSVVHALGEGIIIVDADGDVLECNPAARRMLGLSDAEATGKAPLPSSWGLAKDGRTLSSADHPARVALTTGRSCMQVLAGARRSGDPVRWLRVSADPVWDRDADQPTAVVCSVSDLTDTVSARQAQGKATRRLAEREELFRLLFESAPIGMVLLSTEPGELGRYLRVNPSMCETLGRSEAELISLTASDVVHPADREVVTDALHDALGGAAPEPIRVRYLHRSGKTLTAIVHTAAVRDSHDRVKYLLRQVQDITDQQVIEAELRRAQRLEAVGALAAGIAHEINTPIQFIGDNLSFLDRAVGQLLSLTQDAPADSDVDVSFLREEMPLAVHQSQDGVDRVAGIVRAMKMFGHPDAATPQDADVDELLRSTLVIARNETKHVADVDLHIEPGAERLRCFASDLRQALLNLVVNAAHAIAERQANGEHPARGRIDVSARREGGAVCFCVTDDGTGIPTELRERVFEPFFTTKEPGRGTGQGLALVHHIAVERHKGRVELVSEVGKGTEVRLWIPEAPASSAAGAESAGTVG